MNKNVPVSGDYTQSLNLFVFEQIPENSQCLDVGCWTGNLGRELVKKKNCVVDGIDVDASVLKTAKRSGYRDVFTINLNNDPLKLDLKKRKYDVIVYADILEHLINPDKVLEEMKKFLKPGGIIIVSMPNIGFFLNRVQLLLGKWEYRDFGCMDKTHVRFFTISSAIKLVVAAGYKIQKVKPYNQFGMLRYLNKVNNIYPPLFAYQTLIIAEVA